MKGDIRLAACSRTMTRIAAVALTLALMPAQSVLAIPSDGALPSQPTTIQVPASQYAPLTPAPLDSDALTTTPDPSTDQFRAVLGERQARVQELEAQLDELARQGEVASEAYKATEERLNVLKAQLQTTTEDLAKAEDAYKLQVKILSDRADGLYREGELSTLDVLLGSDSVGDLFKRAQFLTTIGTSDANLVETMQNQRDQIVSSKLALEQANRETESLEFDLKARKIEVELLYAEREQMLAQANGDVLALLQTEAARRAADESVLFQNIVSGANNLGIVVTPDSPVETALAYHGVPYLWGGETPAAFDCSGLVLYVFQQHGVSLPHYSGSQALMGTRVTRDQLLPGDVVFFGSPVHHVGIYLGSGYYVHAPKTGDFVKVSRLSDRNDYSGARRYDWLPRTTSIAGISRINTDRVNHGAGIDLSSVIR